MMMMKAVGGWGWRIVDMYNFPPYHIGGLYRGYAQHHIDISLTVSSLTRTITEEA